MECKFVFSAKSSDGLNSLFRYVMHEMCTDKDTSDWNLVGKKFAEFENDHKRFLAGEKFVPISMDEFRNSFRSCPRGYDGLSDESTLEEWEEGLAKENSGKYKRHLNKGKMYAAVHGFIYSHDYEPHLDDEPPDYHWPQIDDGHRIEGNTFRLWVKNSVVVITRAGVYEFEVWVSGKRTSLALNQTGRLAHHLLNDFRGEITELKSTASAFDCTSLRVFGPTLEQQLRAVLRDAGVQTGFFVGEGVRDLPRAIGMALGDLLKAVGGGMQQSR